ncbi:ATP-binding cassette domain-containing protein [Actinomadura litoris]|uniref:ATP-binding cassette domain-containing protein n=1 Tax=Actinomadura litoris TaxID=2678616 RepID=UPI001FA7B931|nr:ATP-binding cassette domain-containing protein [Actinomadura litoris]
MSIELERCTFRYGRGVNVLNELSIALPAGTTVLLGPNGAGKSTLLAILASRFTPRTGSVRYEGLNPARRRDRTRYRQLVGWMPQGIRPVPGLTVREQVGYAGWLKGMTRGTAWRGSLEALDRVSLGPLADRRADRLSGGQLRRVGLAQTLIHDAKVLLLDEPTAGLDPHQRERFRTIVGGIAEDRDVIVSTHQTEDLTDLYDSVMVLDAGSVRFAGTTAGFLALAGPGSARPVDDAYARLVAAEI